jgi:hypothetical protein
LNVYGKAKSELGDFVQKTIFDTDKPKPKTGFSLKNQRNPQRVPHTHNKVYKGGFFNEFERQI